MKLRSGFAGVVLAFFGAVAVLAPSAAHAGPMPDISVTNVCAVNGYQSVMCKVTMTNIGGAASGTPITVVNTSSKATAGAIYAGSGGSLQPLSCTGVPNGSANQTATCTSTTSLAPGDIKMVFFTFGFGHGGLLQDCATVTTPGSTAAAQHSMGLPDSNPANNTNVCSSITVAPPPPPPAPDLSLTNSCAMSGTNAATCTLTVKNIGNAASVSSVSITDTETMAPGDTVIGPHGGSFQPLLNCSGTVGGSIQPQTCNFNLSLSPGDSRNFYFGFNSVQGGQLTDCATVTEASSYTVLPDSNTANNTNICASVSMPSPPPVCLTNSAGPVYVTGNASNTSLTTAQNMAESNWSNQAVQAGGQVYWNVNHAVHPHMNCSTSSPQPFSPSTSTCYYSAQPCK